MCPPVHLFSVRVVHGGHASLLWHIWVTEKGIAEEKCRITNFTFPGDLYLHDHRHGFVHMVCCMLVMWLHMVLPLPHHSHNQVSEYLNSSNTDRIINTINVHILYIFVSVTRPRCYLLVWVHILQSSLWQGWSQSWLPHPSRLLHTLSHKCDESDPWSGNYWRIQSW